MIMTKVLVITGSPKGVNSITLQTVLYIEKFYPGCEFEVMHAGQRIRMYEKDFSECAKKLEEAELILFCYPVYTFIVPSQLHRFIELMKENNIDCSGKYASQISTSKHFYDMTAHQFIQDNCDDLGLKFIRGLSADMDDLLSEKGQREALSWFDRVMWSMRNDCFEPVRYPVSSETYTGKDVSDDVNKKEIRRSGKVVIVTDYDENDSSYDSLRKMIRRFEKQCTRKTETVNLHDFPFAGGCLGCFRCASDGTCIYKDGFDSYLREHIQQSEAIVYAYRIQDHSMGYRFKMYDDRQFCNGHRTVTMGRPQGYLVSGALSREYNLQTIMEARAQVGGNVLCGAASDEYDPDREIDQLAASLEYAIGTHYSQPQNFWGVGGLKIFRDLIWQMQGLMKEDHRFYKEHGFYDFPQKKRGRMIGMYAVGAMMTSPKVQKKLGSKMTEGMLLPYRKVIEKASK